MVVIDLDRLKEVNDTLGHAAGHELIKSAASVLLDTVIAGFPGAFAEAVAAMYEQKLRRKAHAIAS